VLSRPKADELAVGCKECRMTQAAEVPTRLHKDRIVRGFQIMRPDKLSVNIRPPGHQGARSQTWSGMSPVSDTKVSTSSP
jgi:hypothetical protein